MGYTCVDQSTEQMVQIIRKHESRNEVHLSRTKGDVEEEKATGELLEILKQNMSKGASMQGTAWANRGHEGYKPTVHLERYHRGYTIDINNAGRAGGVCRNDGTPF